jgi:hypothetical protein
MFIDEPKGKNSSKTEEQKIEAFIILFSLPFNKRITIL